MAKSFKELVEKTSNENSRTIAAERTKQLLKEFGMDKITWLDLYNFLYNKAHDFNNLGNFDWSAEVRVLNPKDGVAKQVETNTDLLSAGVIGYFND